MTKLTLFVAGNSPSAIGAIERVRKIIDANCLPSDLIEVVDVLQDPARALAQQLIVTPTLVVSSGDREAVFAGDLTAAGRLDALAQIAAAEAARLGISPAAS